MVKMVKCKACGFIMKESALKDVCPACGLPAKVFESYTENISAERKRILSLHIHPVLVHFPQAFASILFLFSIAITMLNGPVKEDLLTVFEILALILPVTLAAAFFSGILDGKARFKKVAAPALRKKILIGCLFFIVSVALAVFTLTLPPGSQIETFSLVVSSACCMLCAIPLGLMGSSLSIAKLPGK